MKILIEGQGSEAAWRASAQQCVALLSASGLSVTGATLETDSGTEQIPIAPDPQISESGQAGPGTGGGGGKEDPADPGEDQPPENGG